MTPRPQDRDRGFTLIETIAAVALLPIVVGAMAVSLYVMLRTFTGTQQRLTESANSLQGSDYFVTDAQSATTIGTTDATCNNGYATALTLAWTEDTSPTTTTAYRVDYGLQTISGQPSSLHRTLCVNSVLTRDVVLDDAVTAASCSVPSPCTTAGADLQLQVTDKSGFVYVLDGRKRAS
jgi:prepilin-type N-terminal cleavage/methylation domain-containing protein